MPKTVTFPKIERTPLQKAQFEIMALRQKPELQKNHMIGGPTPPEIRAENERKDQEHRRLFLEIIKKYGVAENYLKPQLEKERELLAELASVHANIADLVKIRDAS